MSFSQRNTFIVIVLISAMVGGLLGGGLVLALPSLRVSVPTSPDSTSGVRVPDVIPPLAVTEDEQVMKTVERVQAAVVSIVVTKDLPKVRQQVPIFPFFGDPFGDAYQFEQPPSGPRKVGGGSGFLVTADGIIVTNRHVVEDAQATYTVLLPQGKEVPAKVLARDPVLDIAFVDIEGDGYPYLSFGDSDKVKVGQTVLAIGNALDEFRNTVTKGIVSGLNRRLVAQDIDDAVVLEGAIQTDAAINPGNSGGPLIDLEGNVIGINTAISRSGQLLGFALPGNVAKRDVEQVKKTGRISRPFLGIRYLVINKELIERNQLKVDYGVLVARGDTRTDVAVIPGSPADKAGIQENDIILEIDGTKIDEEHSLSSLIGRKAPGDKATLKILHQGQEKEVEVVLDEFKPTP